MCCRCVQITESIEKYSGRSARVLLPKVSPCLSGGRIIDGKPRNTPERTPHLVLGVESASVGYIVRPEDGALR